MQAVPSFYYRRSYRSHQCSTRTRLLHSDIVQAIDTQCDQETGKKANQEPVIESRALRQVLPVSRGL